MEDVGKQRDFGLDLVRAAAGVLTLSVHFFLNSGFYEFPAVGGAMLASCMVRTLCMTCVPLFLLLTGYTCIKRKWSKGYYRKLLPVLFTYVLAGAACLAFRIFWLGEQFSLRGIVRQFTGYVAAPYAWYVEMYIGLFLLSPFFNAAWHALEDDGKKALILTLVGLTALPRLVNQVGTLLPVWWEGIYPLTYYALGAWLREHPIRLKGWKLLLYCIALAAAMGFKNYLTVDGGVYLWTMPEDQWGSGTLTLQAVCLFSCLRKAKGDRLSAPIRWCVARTAKLALPMYLVSYIADQIIYPVLNGTVVQAQRLFWMPLVMPVVVICSLMLAQPVDWAAQALMRLVPTKTQDAVSAQCRDT